MILHLSFAMSKALGPLLFWDYIVAYLQADALWKATWGHGANYDYIPISFLQYNIMTIRQAIHLIFESIFMTSTSNCVQCFVCMADWESRRNQMIVKPAATNNQQLP